jgi:hypothetical protein
MAGEVVVPNVVDDDWTPVARSDGDPVATVVLPDANFALEDLRELARELGEAGVPVLVVESPEQRRIIIAAPLVIPIIIHLGPVLEEVAVGVLASAAWEGIKGAFGRLRRRDARGDPAELVVDVRIQGDRFAAHACGPAADAVAEALGKFVEDAQRTG